MEIPNGEFSVQIEDVTLRFREPNYLEMLEQTNKYSSLKWVEYLLQIQGLKLHGAEVTVEGIKGREVYIPVSFYTKVAKIFDEEVAKLLNVSKGAEEKKAPTPT